jgi:hypothetical protein
MICFMGERSFQISLLEKSFGLFQQRGCSPPQRTNGCAIRTFASRDVFSQMRMSSAKRISFYSRRARRETT